MAQDATLAVWLETARRKLLDTSRRNRLIQDRPSRTVGAVVEGATPGDCYASLVVQGTKLRLVGRGESGSSRSDMLPLPEDELLDVGVDGPGGTGERQAEQASTARSRRSLLCTDTEARLAKKLLKTYRIQRTLTEETGVNLLFVALGALEWLEADSAQSSRRSPLLLVPVQLLRRPNQEAYDIEYDGGRVLPNLALGELLRQEFRVELPVPLGDDSDAVELDQHFAQVAAAVRHKADWRVDVASVVLGFYASPKYLLYADLDPQSWPEGRGPLVHSVVTALLDPARLLPNPGTGLSEDAPLDELRPVEDCHEVVSCDASQVLALMEARRGHSMVIQGPPGTGKSQTITNLLADAVARGKRVLFVSEKLAALRIVARNLERVGLQDLCLELHSSKADKGAFYRELNRTLSLGPPRLAEAREELAKLEETRSRLNQYAAAVNTPIQGRGCTPRDAMGELLRLGTELPPICRLTDATMHDWTAEALHSRVRLCVSLDEWTVAHGPPSEHPLHEIRRHIVPTDAGLLFAAAASLADAVALVEAESARAAERLSITPPSDDRAAERLAAALECIAERPVERPLVHIAAWDEAREDLQSWLDLGRRAARIHAEWADLVAPGAWGADVAGTLAELEKDAKCWWWWARPAAHRARRAANALAQSRAWPTSQARVDVCRAVLERRAAETAHDAATPRWSALFGRTYRGLTSDWDLLQAVTDWCWKARDGVHSGLLPPDFLQGASAPMTAKDAAELATAIRKATATFRSSRERLAKLTDAEIPQSLCSVRDMTVRWRDARDKLADWSTFCALVEQVETQGLAELVRTLWQRPELCGRSRETIERSFYEMALRTAFETPVLRGFSRQGHEADVEQFRQLDDLLLEVNRRKIVLSHSRSMPVAGETAWGAVAFIQREMQKRRRQHPIRQAMAQAAPAIQRVKPIFMMSPLSVAMYLPQDGPDFDLVVFDEASQIRPEAAFGSIARATQTIVVGDSMQMPPTSFFERMTSCADEDPAEEEIGTEGLESILDAMVAKTIRGSAAQRDLRWHYRSRHHSLIAPSNGMFYNWRLFIVPSPAPPGDRLGLVLHRLKDTYYERGESRTNPAEAKAIAHAMVEHMRHHPDESAMAVAFSRAQQQAIQDELDLLASQCQAVFSRYDNANPSEPLDVKNLENVQGDERDVVYISIGYGRTKDGYLAQSFGPLNNEGGERRLNVLITRARRRCEVFTNIEPEDIVAPGEGPRALRRFLQYARDGHMDVPETTGRDPMSPFEEAVIDVLHGRGWPAEPQVGCAGFFIDIGVKDPGDASRFILGVECDGAQYHRSATARDRDKLRQFVLEERGWRIHRIWSVDWYANPVGESERLFRAAEQARVACASDGVPPPKCGSSGETGRNETRSAIERIDVPPRESTVCEPYVVADPPRLTWDAAYLHGPRVAEAVRDIVRVETPVHIDIVIKRLRDAALGARTGHHLRSAIENGVDLACRLGVQRDGKFLLDGGSQVRPRDRSGLPPEERRPVYVHDRELAAAMALVLRRSVSVPRGDLARAAWHLLGLGRVSGEATQRGLQIITRLVARATLVEDSSGLRVRR